jgi:hypothetical protein
MAVEAKSTVVESMVIVSTLVTLLAEPRRAGQLQRCLQRLGLPQGVHHFDRLGWHQYDFGEHSQRDCLGPIRLAPSPLLYQGLVG